MSAVADLQSTIVKRYEGDPRVIVAVMSGDTTTGAMQTFWSNLWLRGPLLLDTSGTYAMQAYGQPDTLLPFGRSFIVTDDEVVVFTGFGYEPDGVIKKIDALLAGG